MPTERGGAVSSESSTFAKGVPVPASWPCPAGTLTHRLGCSALLRKQFIHAACRHLREQRDNAFIAAKCDSGAHQIFDRSFAFGLHPPPRSMGYAGFGGCRLLSQVKGQAAGLDPLAETRQLILESEEHGPYMAL